MSEIQNEAPVQVPVAAEPAAPVAQPTEAAPAAMEPATEVKADEKTEETATNGNETTQVAAESTSPKNDRRDNGNKRDFNNKGPRTFKKYESKKKFDPSKLPITDDAGEIRAQVDFYFGDSNLPTDEHMMTITGGPANMPVPVRKICEFGRMRRFQPYEAVVEALKTSKVVEVSGEPGKETIKRRVPFAPNHGSEGAAVAAAKEARSVYVKGFGDEEATTQFDVEAFFAPHGPTNAVRLRRADDNKAFKGSVYVEFATEELAKAFLALDPKPKWKGETELEIMSKRAYVDKCNQEIADGTRKPKQTKAPFKAGGRGGRGGKDFGRGGRGGNRGGDRDPNDWKKRREDDQKGGFRGGRGGRGGGRGRGNPNREARGPRPDNNRNEEKAAEAGFTKASVDPTYANAETRPDKAAAPAAEDSKKRAREDDGAESAPAKKVDSKPEPAASA